MPKSQRNNNFIDKTFTVIADLILKFLPVNKKAKVAFASYRDGMQAQSEGEYSEALEYYYEALRLEEDPYDRSYNFYNIALIFSNMGEYEKALDYYQRSINLNSNLPQAFNNMAVIYHMQAEKYMEQGNLEAGELLFNQAGLYWKQAIRLAPDNYIEAQNWLRISGR
uniref:Photosystem I assembly protein Ycf3 n=1 Tax=Gloeochaete wittrockiana TaxID=38269 RepID=A0A3G1IW65_9EUKA|nr:photosystem I assembly protein Ycf3 [Gloeochaete wittrockiana]ASQ40285.1 photosystem I assembly protein Ycf3 [Gloeochaete wittrockiana]